MGYARYFRRNWQMYALLVLPITFFIIFKYGPMYGVQIAFKDFNFSGESEAVNGSAWTDSVRFLPIMISI